MMNQLPRQRPNDFQNTLAAGMEGACAPEPSPSPSPSPSVKLLVKGFRSMELRLLDGTVKVSQRRTPRLELLTDDQARAADVVMIDTLDPQAMAWAAGQRWLEHTTVIWVDGASAAPGHTIVRRPVQWPVLPMLLARALEQGPKRSTDAMPSRRADAALPGAARRPVLVIDDSLAVRAFLRSLLEARGIEVDDRPDAEAGIDAAIAKPYACILMDVLMPGIDGYEACRRIKARLRSDRAPAILMLTSKSSPFDRIRGKMAGCDAYLTKPLDPAQLHEVLAGYLDAPAHSAAPAPERALGTAPRLAF